MKKLFRILRNPKAYFNAWRRRNWPVIDLDNPENNCNFCGIDHCAKERMKNEE